MRTFGSALARLVTRADWQRRGLVGLVLLALAASPVPLALRADFSTAQAARAAQHYAVAASALADAAERLPYVGQVAYQAGLAEVAAGQFAIAISHLRASATLEGWTPEKRAALGDAYLGQGDPSAATEQWALALKERPTDTALLQRLAGTYEASGRYTETVALLSSMVALGQATPEMYYRLALLTAATAPADALARLTVVADIAPAYAAPAKTLRQAIETGQRANDEAYTFGLTGFTLLQLKEAALAEMALTHAVALNPSFARAYAYLGLAQDAQNKDGRTAYETALRLEPNSAWINYMLGLHWRQFGEGGTAIDYFKRALTLDAQNPAFAAELATTYMALNDLAQSERWFREAVRLAPQDAHFWFLLARFYCDQNYHVAEEGLPAARQAVGLAPADAAAIDTLGCALWLTGDLVNAEKNLRRALALEANLPSAYYHLGEVYSAQGQTAKAEELFNHALALDPQGFYGRQAFQSMARLSGGPTPTAQPPHPTPP